MTGAMQYQTILVVDDNPDIRRLAQMFLEQAGYTVVTAADGEQGLRFYQEQRSRIHLLLTDIVMPNMNGLALAARVLQIDSQLPVLLMSGDARNAHCGLESIAKPFRPDELLEMVRKVLSTRADPETTVFAA
jgi:DNA-binding NtrC family response regulator